MHSPSRFSSPLRALAVAGIALILVTACKKAASQFGDLTGPSSTTMTGTWAGTLSRPGGLAPIAVRWQVTRSENNLTGPMTLTNGASSVTFTMGGMLSGPNADGYGLNLRVSVAEGGIATLPSCSIINNGTVDASGLREGTTNITTNTFTISYRSCNGFVDPEAPRTVLDESTQLVLNKQ